MASYIWKEIADTTAADLINFALANTIRIHSYYNKTYQLSPRIVDDNRFIKSIEQMNVLN